MMSMQEMFFGSVGKFTGSLQFRDPQTFQCHGILGNVPFFSAILDKLIGFIQLFFDGINSF